MLSYLKDTNTAPATEAMENGPEQNASQQYLTVSGQDKKLRQNTIVLGLLFAVGGLGIWLMVQKITPKTVNAAPNEEQLQLDTALAQLSAMQNEVDTHMTSVAGRFDQFSNVNQIAVEELKKNPFQLEAASDSDSNNTKLVKRQQLAQEAQRRLVGLELWSITSTPRGMCCMIGEKVLYENDEINGMTVQKIAPKSVTLDYQGVPVQLKMDQ